MTTDKNFGGFLAFMGMPRQRNELIIMALALTIIGVIFHALYPFPFTFPDSGAYVLSAKEGVFNVYRPMGYSSYMSFVHNFFGAGTTTLFVVSYTLSAMAMLFMLFSAKYLLDIRRGWVFAAMCAVAILSPRIIFSTNFIMSDGLFNTLTMLFIATAMWIVFTRNLWILAAHLLIFILLFKVRYSGMFYVPVSMAAIYFSYSGKHLAGRLAMMLVPVAVFGALYTSTKKEYVAQTHVDTFSAFSGWQLINNASVLLPDAKEIKSAELDRELRLLHSFIQQCPDSLFSPHYAMTTDYMWNNILPYKQFLFYYGQTRQIGYTQSWVETGEMYGRYARALIAHYPARYVSRFVIPSLLSNFTCGAMHEEKIVFRNEPIYRDYFGIDVETFQYERRIFQALYPVRKVMNWVYWIALGVSAVYFCITKLRRGLPSLKERMAAAILLGFLLIYLGSSTLASPNTTWRYTMPMFVPSIVFIFYCISEFLRKCHMSSCERI